jgi:uncharacterized protein YbaR (Trm112 family)
VARKSKAKSSGPARKMAGETGGMDPKMLELLACPLTKGPLEYDAEHGELISRSARLAYPVRDGIPIMLPSEARVIEND